MSTIIFVQPDGSTKEVTAKPGVSLMEAAVANLIPGIEAECGGACACATCHVYIDEGWFAKLPAPQPMEADLLECAVEPTAQSRLACQVRITDATDGLVVRLPNGQS